MPDTSRLPYRKRTRARWRGAAVTALCLAALLGPAGAAAAPSPEPASTSTCHASWKAVETPNNAGRLRLGLSSADFTESYSALDAVAALSTKDVWAAGAEQVIDTPPHAFLDGVTVVDHWDGKGWSRIASPTRALGGRQLSILRYLSFSSPTDGWAAGYAEFRDADPLVEHWDGRRWTISPTLSPPFQGYRSQIIVGLAAFSPTDAWIAVENHHEGAGPAYGMLERWDGTAWRYVDYPLQTSEAVPFIHALYGRSPSDIWLAAGIHAPDSGEVGMHWDGSRWTVEPMPLPADATNWIIRAFSGTSPGDVWAVGSYFDANQVEHPLMEHWNGTSWARVAGPAPAGSPIVEVYGVTAVSPSDAWAVGTYKRGPTPPGHGGDNLIGHWDGRKWTVVPAASVSPDYNAALWSIAAVAPTDIWAVGSMRGPGTVEGSILPQMFHYGCG